MALCGVDEAQEQSVGQPRATQASPRSTAPLPPLRDGRELSKKTYLWEASGPIVHAMIIHRPSPQYQFMQTYYTYTGILFPSIIFHRGE